jgi:hypothetical protein
MPRLTESATPFSKIKLVKGLAEILLAYKVVFITLLGSFGELYWVKIGLTIFKTWF